MNTLLPILMAVVIGGWAFLSLLGGERTRRARDAEAAAETKEPVEPKLTNLSGGSPANAPVPSASTPSATKTASSPAAKPATPAAGTQPAPRKSSH